MPAPDPTAVLSRQAPTFSEDVVLELLERHWGFQGALKSLVSERDQNFRVTAPDGRRYVLKIANSAEDRDVTDFQIQALIHIETERQRLDLPVGTPVVERTVAGDNAILLPADDGEHVVRLVSFLEGTPLGEALPSPALAGNMGKTLAYLGQALAGFEHPGSQQSLLWDMQQALRLRDLIRYVDDPDAADAVRDALDDFERFAEPVLSSSRAQVIHSDLNPDNVVIDSDNPDEVVGVIDFGDMLYAPLIADVAIGCSYLRPPDGDPLRLAVDFVAGYHAVTPLQEAEVGILFDAIQARLCASIAILDWRASERGPDDEYFAHRVEGVGSAKNFLKRLRNVPRATAVDAFMKACGN